MAVNLRNKPIDRRFLSRKDRSDYNQSGAAGRRISAVKRAKARRGKLAWENNSQKNTTSQKPGTGGFHEGRGGLQRKRMQEKSAKLQRSKQLKSEKF